MGDFLRLVLPHTLHAAPAGRTLMLHPLASVRNGISGADPYVTSVALKSKRLCYTLVVFLPLCSVSLFAPRPL